MKKIFLVDSDETLRSSDGTITKNNINAIEKAKKNGDYVIITTGRPRYHSLEVKNMAHASDIVISFNGAEIYDEEKDLIVKAYYLNYNSIIKTIEIAYKYDVRLVLSLNNSDLVTKEIRNHSQTLINKDNYKKQIKGLKILTAMFIDQDSEKVSKAKEEVLNNKELFIANEINKNSTFNEKWFAIANKKVSKGNALKELIKYLHVRKRYTIAIGNDLNDISMFKESGLSVAVANAYDEVKQNAKIITLSNNNSGVAEIINKIEDDENILK